MNMSLSCRIFDFCLLSQNEKFYVLKMLKCLDKAVWDSMGNHHQDALYFGFCLLLVPSKKEKIYKPRQLSLSQFVYFLSSEPSMFTFTKDVVHF